LLDRNGLRQTNLHARRVDREVPTRADRITVEPLMRIEETELARRAIAQREAILGRKSRQKIVAAGVDADAVRQPLGEPRLRHAVALDAEDVKIDDDPVAVAIAVARREVAIDAAPDTVPLRANGDVLRDDQAAVGAHVDLDVIVDDALAGLRRDERRGERENEHARQRLDELR